MVGGSHIIVVQWVCLLEVQSYWCHLLNTARHLHRRKLVLIFQTSNNLLAC